MKKTKKYHCICDHEPFIKKESLQHHLKYNYCFPKQNAEAVRVHHEKTKKRSFKRGIPSAKLPLNISTNEIYNMTSDVNPLVYYSTTYYNSILYKLSNKNLYNFIYNGGGYQWVANKFFETFKDIIFISTNETIWVMLEENTLVNFKWKGFHKFIFIPFWEDLEDITTDEPNSHIDQSFKKHYKKAKDYHCNMPAQFRGEIQKRLKPMLIKYYSDKTDISKYKIKSSSEYFFQESYNKKV